MRGQQHRVAGSVRRNTRGLGGRPPAARTAPGRTTAPLLAAGRSFGDHPGQFRPERGHRRPAEQQERLAGRADVVVDQARRRGAGVGCELFGRVLADEVVEGIPARCAFPEQVGQGELGQRCPGAVGRQGGEASGAGGRDLRSGVGGQHAERPSRVRGGAPAGTRRTPRRSSSACPPASRSSGATVFASSAASRSSGNDGFATARAATTASASGSPVQARASRWTAAGAASARAAPTRRARNSCASAAVNGSNRTSRAPCSATTPARLLRLVMTTRLWPPPGSSGPHLVGVPRVVQDEEHPAGAQQRAVHTGAGVYSVRQAGRQGP